jgi:hypothetical protein
LDDEANAMCGDTKYTEKFIYTIAVILILAITAPFCAMGKLLFVYFLIFPR